MHLLQTLVATAVVLLLLGFILSRRHNQPLGQTIRDILTARTVAPWRAILLAVTMVLLLVFLSINLAAAYHVLGTDKVGQDVFYQTLKSIRTGLVIGTLTTLVMLPFAILLGIMAGYLRGWVDDVIQYTYTTLNR